MKNAVATFQTVSTMAVAIAAPVSPSMLMKKTLATTLTAALRIGRPAAPRSCSVIVMRQLPPADMRDEHCKSTVVSASGPWTFLKPGIAGSTGRRNIGVKSLCRGFELQGLTGPFI
jgi:hypothetical protein